jgi:hypothetical protein
MGNNNMIDFLIGCLVGLLISVPMALLLVVVLL